MFTHLHVHSAYSFLRGVPTISQLVQAGVAEKMPALALCDYQNLVGAVEFTDACQKGGLQPIHGVEVNVAAGDLAPGSPDPADEKGVLVLLAAEESGWRSLCRLISRLNEEKDCLDFETLRTESNGLVCLTGGRLGLLDRLVRHSQAAAAAGWLEALKAIFGDRLYIELNLYTRQDLPFCQQLNGIAVRMGLPTAAAHPVYYLLSEDAKLQQIASAIRLIKPFQELAPGEYAPAGSYFVPGEEMVRRFADFPQALAGTQEIADRCCCTPPVGKAHFPQLDLPAGQTALDVVREKAFAGAIELYGKPGQPPESALTPVITERLEHELDVIRQTGYAALFLIVQDILNHARAAGVPTASRGSASSSLVAHCLGITTPDPIHLNLFFERFLNPARHSPPDIDTDLCSVRRDEVIRYVYHRFGDQRVATVSTINCFRKRSALREVAKAYALPAEEVKLLADALPYRWFGGPNASSENQDPYAELSERHPDALHQEVFRSAALFIGLPHHLSVHPGGVVIAPSEMDDLAPTQMASKGVRITQFDKDSIERLGMVKIDLLGIRGLTVIGDVAEAITQEKAGDEQARRGEASQPPAGQARLISRSLQTLAEIPEDDPLVSEAISRGRTIGCFQIESPGMRSTLREIRARSIDDILVALALYRPGPLTGGLKDAFVRRHLGKETASYLHPGLKPLLEETYGVILYQEQVLRIAHELAGFTLAEADLLRRAMSHFDPGKQMQLLQEKFINSANQRSGLSVEAGTRVWELMAAFAGYGFPKAHAASYAQVAWRAAWCKIHHPAIFMAAVLANWGGYYSQRIYLMEARRMGLTVLPPHVNHARREFSVDHVGRNSVLYMGLDQVRDLTQNTIERIQRLRPFLHLDDFISRVDPRQAEVENLIKVGALDEFGPIPALLRRANGKRSDAGQLSFFNFEAPDTGEDWTVEEKVASQEELLGTSVIAHPLELAAHRNKTVGSINTVEAAAKLNQRVRVAGMRQTWRRSVTTRGEFIYFMALEDLDGMLDVVIFANVYRMCRSLMTDHGPYIVEGTVEFNEEQGEPFIRAEKIERVV